MQENQSRKSTYYFDEFDDILIDFTTVVESCMCGLTVILWEGSFIGYNFFRSWPA